MRLIILTTLNLLFFISPAYATPDKPHVTAEGLSLNSVYGSAAYLPRPSAQEYADDSAAIYCRDWANKMNRLEDQNIDDESVASCIVAIKTINSLRDTPEPSTEAVTRVQKTLLTEYIEISIEFLTPTLFIFMFIFFPILTIIYGITLNRSKKFRIISIAILTFLFLITSQFVALFFAMIEVFPIN